MLCIFVVIFIVIFVVIFVVMEPVLLWTRQIEALLKKINEENRKTKEVLETIHRTHDEAAQHRETTTKVVLSRGNVISLGSKVRKKDHFFPKMTIPCVSWFKGFGDELIA